MESLEAHAREVTGKVDPKSLANVSVVELEDFAKEIDPSNYIIKGMKSS